MKKILKLSTLAFLLIAGVSCENDDQTIATAKGGPELLTPLDGSSYVLDPATASSEATTLVWNHADYDVQTAVNYEVEVALAGTDFADIKSGGTTTNRFIVWTQEALNVVALEAGLTPYTAGDLDIRIKSALGTNLDLAAYSNVITITVTPYTTETPKLWVVGGFQNDSGYGSDWTHATAPQLASEGYGNTMFEGYVYFATDQNFGPAPNDSKGFKISSQPDWGGLNYTDDGTFSGGLSTTASDNISINAGYYRITANTTTLEYNAEATRWAITGSATPLGWPDNGVQDQDMTYNPSTKKWEITISLTAGGNEFKFRANDAWTLNYGDDGNDGSLEFNSGNNLTVTTSGTYLVELDLSNPRNYSWTATLQ